MLKIDKFFFSKAGLANNVFNRSRSDFRVVWDDASFAGFHIPPDFMRAGGMTVENEAGGTKLLDQITVFYWSHYKLGTSREVLKLKDLEKLVLKLGTKEK